MSEFFRRKHRSIFRKLDFNNDGYITREDFELMAARFNEDEAADSPRRQEALEKYTGFFSFFEPMGSTPGQVTEHEWIEAAEKIRNDPNYKAILDGAIRICFDILDFDEDGVIQEEEYIRFLKDVQIADHVALGKKAFATLDTDGDGSLSFEEFQTAAQDFFRSDDESRPGTYLFGPFM